MTKKLSTRWMHNKAQLLKKVFQVSSKTFKQLELTSITYGQHQQKLFLIQDIRLDCARSMITDVVIGYAG